ncbi:MAG: ThiF family adenylyltransferase [Candidatus Hermodarchaeota archaeon]
MFINQPIYDWSAQYWEHVSRNIGLVSFREQELIRTSKIAVLGVGGVGGPVAENLVRVGCQHLVLADRDVFDATNLNRQLCTLEDIGRYKVEVVAEFLQKIDPEVQITKYTTITPSNINKVLDGVDVVALTLDGPITSILIARECRRHRIPMCETWAVPSLFCWFFTPDSIDYETLYQLNTHHLSNEELELERDNLELTTCKSLFSKIIRLVGVEDKYDKEPGAYQMMMKEQIGIRSFAPIVRLNADFLTIELIFAGILAIKPMYLAPEYKEFAYL